MPVEDTLDQTARRVSSCSSWITDFSYDHANMRYQPLDAPDQFGYSVPSLSCLCRGEVVLGGRGICEPMCLHGVEQVRGESDLPSVDGEEHLPSDGRRGHRKTRQRSIERLQIPLRREAHKGEKSDSPGIDRPLLQRPSGDHQTAFFLLDQLLLVAANMPCVSLGGEAGLHGRQVGEVDVRACVEPRPGQQWLTLNQHCMILPVATHTRDLRRQRPVLTMPVRLKLGRSESRFTGRQSKSSDQAAILLTVRTDTPLRAAPDGDGRVCNESLRSRCSAAEVRRGRSSGDSRDFGRSGPASRVHSPRKSPRPISRSPAGSECHQRCKKWNTRRSQKSADWYCPSAGSHW